MSKATWAYRLPTPHPHKPPVYPFSSRKPQAAMPTNFFSSQMDNYEHLRWGVSVYRRPHTHSGLLQRYKVAVAGESAAGRPLWAVDSIQEMALNELIAPPEVYREALIGAVTWNEPDTFRDCWRLMERQRVIPDDKTLCAALEGAGKLGCKDLIFQMWNRYCTEFAFLRHDEQDPKPVRREPFTLTRDELYNLSWWQKRYDRDPNRDLADLHRFNRTREIHAAAAAALVAVGEKDLGLAMLQRLCQSLRDTPTPVAEPLDDARSRRNIDTGTGVDRKQTRYRIPNIYLFTLRRNTRGIDWIPNHEWLLLNHQLGPQQPTRSRDVPHGDPRFYTNIQFILYAFERVLESIPDADLTAEGVAALEEQMLAEVADADAELNFEDHVIVVLEKLAAAGEPGQAVLKGLHERCERWQLRPTPAMYIPVLAALSGECPALDAAEEDVEAWLSQDQHKAVQQSIHDVVAELRSHKYASDLATETAVLEALVRARVGTANDHFVRRILRRFKWGNQQIHFLLREYRWVGNRDTEKQAKLCKRAYLWCNRYNVGMSEDNKQFIEDDYDRIRVQVRTKEELLTWKFKHQHMQREALKPYLPNPVTDRVSHTLHVATHADPQHCENWVVPYSNAGRTFKHMYSTPHAPPQASDVRDLTDVERVKRLPQQTSKSPWKQFGSWRGQSYGYRPELQHEKHHVNKWLAESNKAFPGD
eukprot:TRINITY_DN39326_c0_g1_i1.p1 TRINITY_DN39326_c0_g1~~TRINITY_DN39326_c0_g1_i1.p1  ORF type:complete len:702 (+),score=214.67 TRINITY_DN39326_c0_g1_i1:106-2211(+)